MNFDIASRLFAARRLRKMSRGKVAAEMGRFGVPMTEQVLANFELRRRETLSAPEAAALADALGLNLMWLICGVGPQCSWCNDQAPLGYTCDKCHQKGIHDDDDI